MTPSDVDQYRLVAAFFTVMVFGGFGVGVICYAVRSFKPMFVLTPCAGVLLFVLASQIESSSYGEFEAWDDGLNPRTTEWSDVADSWKEVWE